MINPVLVSPSDQAVLGLERGRIPMAEGGAPHVAYSARTAPYTVPSTVPCFMSGTYGPTYGAGGFSFMLN